MILRSRRVIDVDRFTGRKVDFPNRHADVLGNFHIDVLDRICRRRRGMHFRRFLVRHYLVRHFLAVSAFFL